MRNYPVAVSEGGEMIQILDIFWRQCQQDFQIEHCVWEKEIKDIYKGFDLIFIYWVYGNLVNYI